MHTQQDRLTVVLETSAVGDRSIKPLNRSIGTRAVILTVQGFNPIRFQQKTFTLRQLEGEGKSSPRSSMPSCTRRNGLVSSFSLAEKLPRNRHRSR